MSVRDGAVKSANHGFVRSRGKQCEDSNLDQLMGESKMKWKQGPQYLSALFFVCLAMAVSRPADARTRDGSIPLDDDQPVTLRFYGSPTADLFTRELDASFNGVLETNFYPKARDGFPAGFISASAPGMPWAGTMWTRDAGTFMRELVMRGYYQHAVLMAECLIHLVGKNADGYFTFPRYFKGSTQSSGSESDGTAAIVIAMEELWERLPQADPARRHIQTFLFDRSSPVHYFAFALQKEPLIGGTGEFGCGMGIPGKCYNVVQNNLIMLSLLRLAQMASELGRPADAAEDCRLADKLREGMDKYLVGNDGAWIWAVDTKTLKPDPAVLNSSVNLGTGSLNGVGAMYADVLGFLPLESSWDGVRHSEKTFEDLYNTPLRKAEFDHYGIWTQTDLLAGGMGSSPSYGQGYAIQTMLLYEKLAMAGNALSWLANATYDPIPGYKLRRASPYYLYERTYSPDAVGKVELDEGCGALNLVNVSEPLKVARLLLGVDDLSPGYVQIIPRIPPDWKAVDALNWPIWTGSGIVRAQIHFERRSTGAEFNLQLSPGQQIENLKVRMPSKNGYIWREQRNVENVHLTTE